MKLFFLKDHSLYKIFKTLEKVPTGKTVDISIDPEHAFFDNEWRGKQIQELLQKRNIHAFFITKTENSRRFFEKIGLPVIHQEKHRILKILNLIYLFIFNIKKFHLQAYTKKNQLFYMIFGFEAIFVLLVLYFLYSLILPKTIITIYPSNQAENIVYNFRYYPENQKEIIQDSKNLAIPFKTGFIDYQYVLSISAKNIKHIQNPSQGIIRIINPTTKEYNFLKGTRFVTTDGLVFKSKDWFKLNAKSEKTIDVFASDKDEQGNLIGARGNIPAKTSLYIKNLKESFFLKTIYATSTSQFSGGSLSSEGIVTQKDIEILSGKLLSTVKQQRQNIISQNFSSPGKIFLHFNELISMETISLSIENKIKDKVPYLKGTIIVRLGFAYIEQESLFKQIEKYLLQRPSDKVKLIKIDKSSIVFFSNTRQDTQGAYIIPTKLTVIQGYDFVKDINNVIDSIKTNIVGVDKEKANTILLGYPEISSVKIKITPPRYTSVTRLKSRIQIDPKQ